MRVEQSVPELNEADQDKANAMEYHIKQLIDSQQGWLSFDEFMQQVLYHPELGYYCGRNDPFGRQGDYVTAPQISPLFSQALAIQCQQILSQWQHGQASILEIGAGSGEMAAELMRYLAHQQCLPKQYAIWEISPSLRQKQKQYIQKTVPHLMPYFVWYEDWPAHWRGIILANEVLDALPVKLWQWHRSSVQEWGIGLQENRLVWQQAEPDTILAETINHIQQSLGGHEWVDGYYSEAHVGIAPWIGQLAQSLEEGVVLLFDYGYPRAEYYRQQRPTGTLKCFYQHISHEDPLIHLGCQDITAHVDFTTVIEQAYAQGMTLEGFCTQADFLLSCGIDNLTPSDYTMQDAPKVSLAQQLKQLLMPEEMGEIVKVMGLSKGYSECLQGFERRDLSRLL